jgi:tetratricopeptide (TPR) repeat protein
LATLKAALARDPNNDATHLNIGYAKLLRGDREGAQYHFREALRLDPHDLMARDALAAVWRNAFAPFRWATRVSLWLARISIRARLAAGLVIGLVCWLALTTLIEVPVLAPHFDLLILAVCVALIVVLFADELANAVLFLHPLGRREMRPRTRAAALSAAAWVLSGLGALVAGLLAGDAGSRHVISMIGQQASALALAQLALFRVPPGWPTKTMAAGVAVCAVLVGADIAYGFLGKSSGLYWAGWYASLAACLVVFSLGGALRHKRVKQ